MHAVELDEQALRLGRAQPRRLAGSTSAWATWPTAFPDLDGTRRRGGRATRRTSRWRPSSRWPPRPATTTPSLALWSGEDGLDAMRVVERVAARLLAPGGVVGAEHADVQGESAPGGLRRRPGAGPTSATTATWPAGHAS